MVFSALYQVITFVPPVQLIESMAALPFWSAPLPDRTKPLFGYDRLPNVTNSAVYFGSSVGGFYNHAAMMSFFESRLMLSWKNAPLSEDTPGQRVLFSESSDGLVWSRARILFPNVSTAMTPAAQFAGPFASINGRLYASATPAIIADGDAQGAQFCLWPDGLDPRNCATPDRPGTEPSGLLMMRQIIPSSMPNGSATLGPVFWAYDDPPKVLAAAAAANGVVHLHSMDATTRGDIARLTANGVADAFIPPCDGVGPSSGTLKCEGCVGGCQLYDSPGTKGHGIANERCHYDVPHSSADAMLFRSHANVLYASVRGDTASGQAGWSAVGPTSIPNDNSNLNCGSLPEAQGVFIVANAAPAKVRDPLTIALSADGRNFSTCSVVQTCIDLPLLPTSLENALLPPQGEVSAASEEPSPPSIPPATGCKARQDANHNVGPSYPQAVSVVGPGAPESMRALYVVATNNKEDVVVSKVPWSVLSMMA